MAGMRGRSGRILTPEAAQVRSAAMAAGARNRIVRERAEAAGQPPPPALTPEQERAAEKLGAKLLPPISWREAYQRQQAALAALKREKMTLEIESIKRDRIPIGDVRNFVERLKSIVLRELATLPGIADKIPEGTLSQQMDAIRRELALFAESYRKTITETDL